MRRYNNGLYVGLGAGVGIPTQAIRNGFNSGVAVDVPIGWDSPFTPIGFRVNFGYTQLGARNSFRNTGTTTSGGANGGALATNDARIWSALANLKLRLPFFGSFAGPTSGLYAVGGAGLNHFRNYNTTFALTNPELNNGSSTTATTSSQTMTRLALDAGGGISWGFGPAELFLESRYVTALADNGRSSYVPIILGVTFR
jgi:hypothetical protein